VKCEFLSALFIQPSEVCQIFAPVWQSKLLPFVVFRYCNYNYIYIIIGKTVCLLPINMDFYTLLITGNGTHII
jgi:hypothetical protein